MSNKKLEELKVPEVIMDRKNAPRKSSLMAPNHPPVRKRSVSFRPVVVPTDDGKLPNLEVVDLGNDYDDPNDKEVSELNEPSRVQGDKPDVGDDEDSDDESESALTAKLRARPPTPPGVSHKKKDVDI